MRPHGSAVAALAFAAALGAGGCEGEHHRPVGPVTPPPPPVETPPAPDTPTAAVQLLEWCYDRRDTLYYRQLFTGDFRFSFHPADSAGNSFRTDPWGRTHELTSARHLFVGGSALEPPATAIDLSFDTALFAQDTGDALDQATHRRVTTAVALTITVSSGSRYQVQGYADFYVVRADAAAIPADVAKRIRPGDWLVYAWADRTLERGGAGPPAVLATNLSTWGKIKALYL